MLTDGRDQASALISLAYEAAVHPNQWPTFLDTFVSAVGGSMAALLSHDTGSHDGSVSCFVRSDPDGMRAYDEYYHQFDPWARAGDSLFRVGAVVTGDQII